MKDLSCAVAYPGLPIIFAEGFRVLRGRRLSLHASVGAALTDEREKTRTETIVRAYGSKNSLFVDGKPVSGERGVGMLKMVEEMKKRAHFYGGIRVDSKNLNVLSGSSDSGAAALATALDDFFGLRLSREELLSFGVYGSETVFRSLYGGLTEYKICGDKASAVQIASPKSLSDIKVFAVSFPGKRFSADELHTAVVWHPSYTLREKEVLERISCLKGHFREGNLLGVLSLMEEDARTVHRMFAERGKKTLSAPMKKLCSAVEGLRSRGLGAYWNVAGGRQVYVFTVGEYAKDVETELAHLNYEFTKLKIAGYAVAI